MLSPETLIDSASEAASAGVQCTSTAARTAAPATLQTVRGKRSPAAGVPPGADGGQSETCPLAGCGLGDRPETASRVGEQTARLPPGGQGGRRAAAGEA